MAEKSAGQRAGGAATREDRLKAALKANMARRKAQARARDGVDATDTTETTGQQTPDKTE